MIQRVNNNLKQFEMQKQLSKSLKPIKEETSDTQTQKETLDHPDNKGYFVDLKL